MELYACSRSVALLRRIPWRVALPGVWLALLLLSVSGAAWAQEEPTITNLSPPSATAGGPAFTLTVNGTNFFQCFAAPCLAVNWQPASGGSTVISAQANGNGTQLTATISASLIAVAGSVTITVQAEYGTSNSLPFTINNAGPTLTNLSPGSATAGGPAFTLTVNGTNFIQCAAAPCLGVNWQPASGVPTFISAQANAGGTQLMVAIPAALIAPAGAVRVSVQAAGGTSNPLTFTVNNGAPTITSLSPASAAVGGPAFTLTVDGTNFVQCAASSCLGITWQPANGGSTVISGQANAGGTQLTAAIPAALIATAGIAHVSVQAAGGTSNSLPFTVSASGPTITSLSPSSTAAGGPAFTLTVNGANFVQCSNACLGVNWQPAAGASTFISGQATAGGTQLFALIPAALIAAPGTASVSVQAAGGTSNSVPFAVNGPAPTIISLSPASATAGGPGFTLTVGGFGFIQCAPSPCLGVNWQPASGGSTFLPAQANVNGTQLTASIQAELIASAGTANLTVQSVSGTSNTVPFIIVGGATGGTQISAGHLIFPNVGLNALQEFDPVMRAVVNTISLPAPFAYSGSPVIETVRIRQGDKGILTNAYANGNSAVVALSSSGQFVAAEQVSGGLLQELAFDPLDGTQSTVLAGNPSSPNVIAVDPYGGSQSTRISQQGASYTGLATDAVGRIYAGNSATGQIFRYLTDGTEGSLFSDVLKATGSSEIDALAIDSDGNVYAAQGSSNRIAVFNSTGTFVSFLTNPGFNQNAYVYFNPNDGLLYAGNQADDALTILTTAGTPVATVHMGGKAVGVPDVVPGSPAAIQAGMETTLTGLTFQTPQGGSAPPAQSFALLNNTPVGLTFTTSVSTTSGGSWLTVSGGSGSVGAGQLGAPITVSVNPSGLASSAYYGLIEIDAAGVSNTPQFVVVVVNVLSATANPGAPVTPTGMIFTAVVNGANPAAQSVAVGDVLSRTTTFTVTGTTTTSPNWFTFTPSEGAVQPGQTLDIQVQANVGNLAAGVYSGTLTLQFPEDNVTRQIALLLVVASSATEVQQGKYAPRQAINPCQPTQLLMVFTQLGAGFSQYASWPATLETFVVDDCGVPMASGSVTVSFSDGEATVPLISQNDGTWSQTWAPSGTTSSVTLTANAVEGALKGSTQIGGTVQGNSGVPVLNANGTVSAASYSPIAIPSPGELVSIFGSNLADGVEAATQLPLPTQMQNAFVLLGGQTMPLLYVSPTQINAVVPYGLPGGTAQQAVARHGSSLSVPQRVPLAAADPAFFTTNASGQGQGHIYVIPPPKYDTQILASSSTPSTAGDILTMYCTGLGTVNQPVTAGSAAPSNPLAHTVSTVTVSIGGQPAKVGFAGLAPGFAGLYQINATVPSGVPTGDQIPVVIMVDGISSPVVTIAVQ